MKTTLTFHYECNLYGKVQMYPALTQNTASKMTNIVITSVSCDSRKFCLKKYRDKLQLNWQVSNNVYKEENAVIGNWTSSL